MPPALLTIAPSLTTLAANRVRPNTQRISTEALQGLLAWLRLRALPSHEAGLWDTALATYV